MATNPFYIEPLGGADIGGTLVGLGGLMQRRKEMDARAAHREEEEARRVAQEQQTAQAKKAVLQAYRSGDPNQIAEAMATYPEMQKELTAAIGFKNEATKNNMLVSARKILQNPDKAEEIIRSRIAFVDSNEGDSSHMKAELKNLKEDREGFLKGTREIYAGLAPKQEWEAYAQRAGIGPKEESFSAVSKVLPGGYARRLGTRGADQLIGPSGEILTGNARADAQKIIDAAEVSQEREKYAARRRGALEEEAELKPLVESGVIQAKDAAEASIDAYKRLEPIQNNISTINEAIALIDEGADTGFINSKLPNVRANAVRLNNIQRRLGLDIISTGKFGPLSETELDVALSTALPTALEPPELRKWLVERRDAQEKLADYLESAALYLGVKGNTVPGWLEKQRNKRAMKERIQTDVQAVNAPGVQEVEGFSVRETTRAR